MLEKTQRRLRRKARVWATLNGTASKPRLSVFRSNRFIYAQLIDDDAGKTICSANDMKLVQWTKTDRAAEVGKQLAEKAMAAGVQTCIFDRGGFLYAGRVQSLADGARQGGLQF